MKASKAVREFLAAAGALGGAGGTGECKIRGGRTEAERQQFYARLSRKGVKARAAKRREKE